MKAVHRWVLKTARLIHLFVSMLGLLLLLFFAITGFLLNHVGDWEWLKFSDEPTIAHATVPAELVQEGQAAARKKAEHDRKQIADEEARKQAEGNSEPAPAKSEPLDPTIPLAELKIIEFLRTNHDLRGEAKCGLDENVINVKFAAPGRTCDADINCEDNTLTLSRRNKGLLGRLIELHQGNSKSGGWIWSLLLDLTCFLMVFLALTGLVIWSSLRTRRLLGLGALVVGTAVTLAVYFWAVP